MIPMREIFKSGLFRFLFTGFNFLAGLFIAGFSGTHVFGIISLMVANAAVFHIITGLGFDSSIVWHGASSRFSPFKIFTVTFLSAITQILLFVAVSYIYSRITGHLFLSKLSAGTGFYYELFYFSGLVLLDKYGSMLYAQHKSVICNKVLLLITFIGFVFLALCWFKLIHVVVDPFIFFCLFTFLQAASLILLYHFKNNSRLIPFTKDDISSFLGFSFIVFITNLIQFIAYRLDYWLISYYLDNDHVGVYAQANKFAQLLWVIPNIIAALAAPALLSGKSNFKEKDFAGITRTLNYLNLLLTGGVILTALIVYTNFLPDEFSKGFRPLLFMLPGFYFFTITLLLAAYFSAKRLLWVNFTGSFICLAIISISDIILIPRLGIEGAAWANTIAYATATTFNIIMFLKISKIPVSDLFRFKKEDWNIFNKLT